MKNCRAARQRSVQTHECGGARKSLNRPCRLENRGMFFWGVLHSKRGPTGSKETLAAQLTLTIPMPHATISGSRLASFPVPDSQSITAGSSPALRFGDALSALHPTPALSFVLVLSDLSISGPPPSGGGAKWRTPAVATCTIEAGVAMYDHNQHLTWQPVLHCEALQKSSSLTPRTQKGRCINARSIPRHRCKSTLKGYAIQQRYQDDSAHRCSVAPATHHTPKPSARLPTEAEGPSYEKPTRRAAADGIPDKRSATQLLA